MEEERQDPPALRVRIGRRARPDLPAPPADGQRLTVIELIQQPAADGLALLGLDDLGHRLDRLAGLAADVHRPFRVLEADLRGAGLDDAADRVSSD